MRKKSGGSSSDEEQFVVRSGNDLEELIPRDKASQFYACVKLWLPTKSNEKAQRSSATSSQSDSGSGQQLTREQKLTSIGFAESLPAGLRYCQLVLNGVSFVRQLNLSRNGLTDQAAYDVSRKSVHMEMFILNDNHIGNEGGIALAKGLHNLTSLDLSNNQLDEAGIWHIARHLPTSARTLTIDARVTQEGTRTLSQWFKNRIKLLCPNLTIVSST